MTGSIVVDAQRLLAEGQSLEAILQRLHAAGLQRLPLICALRDATKLGLADAVQVVESAQSGRSLAHVDQTRVDLLLQARGATGGWWVGHYRDAVLENAPWLTVAPGRRGKRDEQGSVFFWSLPEPPPTADTWLRELEGSASQAEREAFRRSLEDDEELAQTCPGSIYGRDVDFEKYGAELRTAIANDPFWRDHVELICDKPSVLTLKLRI